MPEVTVLTRRPANPKGLTIITESGLSWRMPTSPSQWEYKDVQRWGQVDREGHKAISRRRGGGLRQLSFSVLVAALDTRVSIERDVARLTEIGAKGWVLRLKGGSTIYNSPCWWYVKDMGLKVNRVTPTGQPTQATVDFQLEEYVNPHLSVIKPPPPPPPPPRSRTPQPTQTRSPIYRYHTVVAGDWLSKLSLRYLGTVGRWGEIYALNRTIIGPNPNLLRPGLRLKIPPK